MQELREPSSYTCGVMLTPVKADALGAEDQACYICYQPFGSTTSTRGGSELPVQIPCGHVFGTECISTWTLLNNSCPLCRKKVRNVDDCPAHTHGPDSDNSNAFSSVLTAQDDVWLDEEVWSSTSVGSEEVVSGSDIDALIEFYTPDLSNVNFDSGTQSFLGTLMCGEHRGFCQRCNGRDPENEVLRPPPLANAHPKPMDIDNIDLVELGAQFVDLTYRSRDWIDEYLNDPTFGEKTLSDEAVDDLHPVLTRFSATQHELWH